jgi:hypothetical protein
MKVETNDDIIWMISCTMHEESNKSCNFPVSFAHFLFLVVASKSRLSNEVATPHFHGATSLRKLLGD